MRCLQAVIAVSFLLAPLNLVDAGQRELNDSWRGAWVVAAVPVQSDCLGRYTNNDVRADLVTSLGEQGFDPGELARVRKIDLKRSRIDIFLDLDEPILRRWHDGPFELYEEVVCKVELRIARPDGGDGELNAALAHVVERHSSRASAQASRRWNERQREAFPPDYEEILAEYEVWKAHQVNSLVQARLDESIDQAAHLTERIVVDAEYLEGFGAGMAHARRHDLSHHCGDLLDRSVGSFVDRPPLDRSSAWADGYRDAQRLFFYLEMAHRLRGCFLPLPG